MSGYAIANPTYEGPWGHEDEVGHLRAFLVVIVRWLCCLGAGRGEVTFKGALH